KAPLLLFTRVRNGAAEPHRMSPLHGCRPCPARLCASGGVFWLGASKPAQSILPGERFGVPSPIGLVPGDKDPLPIGGLVLARTDDQFSENGLRSVRGRAEGPG